MYKRTTKQSFPKRETTKESYGSGTYGGQLETRPISLKQLVNEVKGIYAGLVIIKTKCVDIDLNYSSSVNPYGRMTAEQWQALIGLHRTLLHEHYNFFLASNGIHNFLKILRHRLPHSFEHMLTFIYIAYSMIGLLLKIVPVFEEI
ncbi:hypothetical protein QBC46DRAFT_366574 [Diplogelasinospora grovesii]|uniref:Uncharacterized protein n=1 Tax=Diplogelasinospora grovesii TaxID=303347 RepID=A0AAN6N192_9PEZI|nr:hypothetical protein QBC46DRAFT_366574 [Diplogelasinospora grovesii]